MKHYFNKAFMLFFTFFTEKELTTMALVIISILSSLLGVTLTVCTFLFVKICRSKTSYKETFRETENSYKIINASQNCDPTQLSPQNSCRPQESSQQSDHTQDSSSNADEHQNSLKKSSEGLA